MTTWGGIIDCDPDDDSMVFQILWNFWRGRDPLATDHMVAVGDKYSCALDGGVSCWGDSANGKLDVLINQSKQIAVGFDHATIDDTGVVCWGAIITTKPSRSIIKSHQDFSWSSKQLCYCTGVVCWGINTSNRSTPPALGDPTDLDVGADHACAIDDTGWYVGVSL